MKRYIWLYNEGTHFHAGTKAIKDCNRIMLQAGWEPFETNFTGRWLSDIVITLRAIWQLLWMPRASVFFVQFPCAKFGHVITMLLCWRFRTIVLVHDINSLRGVGISGLSAAFWQIRSASVVIVHTPAMSAWLRPRLPKPAIVELQIFDYLHNEDHTAVAPVANEARAVVFAGNLAPGKAGFLYQPLPEGRNIHLYGGKVELDRLPDCYTYEGVFAADEPRFRPQAFMGLVWDGTSVETCDGIPGHYQRFNAPHKTSLYLSAALPVFIWAEAAMAPFVKNNQCGIPIQNLHEMMRIVESLSEEEYAKLKAGAARVGARLRQGFYTLSAVERGLDIIQGCPERPVQERVHGKKA